MPCKVPKRPSVNKFWYAKPLDTSEPFRDWQAWHSEAPPQTGEHFLARPVGSNRAIDTYWNGSEFCTGKNPIVIHQWLTYKEFTEVKACLWKTKPNY